MNIHYDKKRNTNIKQLHRTFNMLRHNLSTLCVLTLWSLYIPFSYLKIQFCGIHQFKCSTLNSTRAFLIAQLVKNPPVMQETPVWGLIPGSGISPGEGKGYPLKYSWASLVAQMVKDPPAIWETWVWYLGWEDPL